MLVSAGEATRKAQGLAEELGTRDATRIARELGIFVSEKPFHKQKGVYFVVEGLRFIILKHDLHPVMREIVLLHEIGHDVLHKKEAIRVGGFAETDLFSMRNLRLEHEANLFAAAVSLPDDEFLDCVSRGYDTEQIACAMHSDKNLVALKIADLRTRGFEELREQEARVDFLR